MRDVTLVVEDLSEPHIDLKNGTLAVEDCIEPDIDLKDREIRDQFFLTPLKKC